MVTLTVGKNSYGTLTDANAYLDESARAALAWLGVGEEAKKRALITAYRLIERQTFLGTAKGVNIIDTVAVNTPGSGYALNDLLTVSGGTFGEAAQLKVTGVSGGAITAVDLIHAGTYTEDPSSPASVSGGSGSGADFTVTFKDQVADFPREGLVDADGDQLEDDEYPTDLKSAQFELAYEISQDTGLETQENTGTNRRRVKAGEVEVEFFQPKSGLRFPLIVQELLRQFLTSSASLPVPTASGTGDSSVFDDEYGLSDGI